MESIVTKPLNVLVIEDNASDRELLHKLLLKTTLSISDVKFANCLNEALGFLEKASFDIVFLDLGLPDSHGIDSVNRINTKVPDIPIVVLSGLYGAEMGIAAVQNGVEDYLVKWQFDPDLLARAVRYAIERRRAKKILWDSLKNMNAIFDAAPIGMMLVDKNMVVKRVNNAIRRMLNRDYQKIINKQFGDAMGCINTVSSGKGCGNSPACELCRIHKTVDTILESQKSVEDVEIRPTFKVDGQRITRWFCISGEPAIVDGCIHAVIAINDITEVKTAERERQLAEHKYRTIFENSAVSISLVDEQERLISWNKFTENLFGMDKEDLYLKPVKSLYPEEQWRKIRSQNIRQKGMQHHLETQILRKDGKLVDVDISLSVLKDLEEKIIGSIGVIRDITERKRMEQNLKETMEMKSQFISTVSHELRTPLVSMKEAISIVSDEMTGEVNEEQRKFLDIAKRNIDRLSRLINDFLDFQRLSANRMRFNIQDNDIREVITDVYQTMTPHAKKKGIHFYTELDDDLPRVGFDSDKIIQVLTNLVSNSIKFTPKDGQVAIHAQQQGEDLAISVSDTGMGMPKEALPKIFEQFYRAHQPDIKVKGTGLGLSIVKKIIDVHNGRIEVESQVGKGTTFTVFLPLFGQTAPKCGREETVPERGISA